MIASLFFYASGEPRFVFLFMAEIIWNWLLGLVIGSSRSIVTRKLSLVLCIAGDLAVLGVFKYADFFAETISSLTHTQMTGPGLTLPIGISFYTFQAISYAVDIYRGESPQKNPLLVALYLALFPQLVAGPIVRYTDLEEQLIAHPRPTWEQMRRGLRRFCVGLAKKVLLADALGRFWGQMNADFTQAGALGAWLGLIAFSFQIYFDFSGYSDMAIGLGEAMGFVLPENFDHPYRSRSLTEFWRKWHISLTTWFTEYVYIPMGGNRRGTLQRDLNLLIVWSLTGLWHGAGWNFVLWGLFFAVLLILEKRFIRDNSRLERVPTWLRQCFTYIPVLFGWGLFSGFGIPLFSAMFGSVGFASSQSLLTCAAFAPLLLLCAFISFAPRLPRVREWRFAAPVLMLLCLAALVSQGYAPFVYFQF